MATVVTITIVLLIVFLIIVIGLLIAYQKQKLCFQGKVKSSLYCFSSRPIKQEVMISGLFPCVYYRKFLRLQRGESEKFPPQLTDIVKLYSFKVGTTIIYPIQG